jgi:hypothetical protein
MRAKECARPVQEREPEWRATTTAIWQHAKGVETELDPVKEPLTRMEAESLYSRALI